MENVNYEKLLLKEDPFSTDERNIHRLKRFMRRSEDYVIHESWESIRRKAAEVISREFRGVILSQETVRQMEMIINRIIIEETPFYYQAETCIQEINMENNEVEINIRIGNPIDTIYMSVTI